MYRLPVRNPFTLTAGNAMRVPAIFAGSAMANAVRATSNPLRSSPWISAVRQSVGPGFTPRLTNTTVFRNDPSKLGAWA